MLYKKKRHITGLYAHRRPLGGSGYVRLGRCAIGALPRLTPPQFCSPAILAVCLFGLQNRRIQPERYAKCHKICKKCIKKYTKIMKEMY